MFKLPSIAAPLMQSASKDGLLRNSFRIFGLRSDATGRQIDAAIRDLRVHLELGEQGMHAFAPSQFDDGMLAQAGQRMRDSVTRFCDECFWFWPLDLGADDMALDLIGRGDKAGAAREWYEFLDHPGWGPIARHNLAMLSLHESVDNPDAISDFGEHAAAFLSSEACLKRIKDRLKTLDDPRLARGSADAFVHDLRLAITRTQIRAAMSLGEQGEAILAGKHIKCALAVAGSDPALATTAEAEFDPKLRDLDDRCQRSPGSLSDAEWQALARDTQRNVERMRVFPGLSARAALSGNEVARFLMQVAVHSHNDMKNSQRALAILEAAKAMSSGETLEKVRQNISTLGKILQQSANAARFESLDAKFEGLLATGFRATSHSIESLLREVNALADSHDDKSDLENLYKKFGFYVRGLAVDAYNKTRDCDNAERLLALAQTILDAARQRGINLGDLASKLFMDKITLENNRRVAESPSYSGSPSGNSCMVALIALLCLTAAAGYAAPIAAEAVHAWITLQLR